MKKISQWLLSRNKIASRLAETDISNLSVVLAFFGIALSARAFFLANTNGSDDSTIWQVVLMITAFIDFVPIVMGIYDDKD